MAKPELILAATNAAARWIVPAIFVASDDSKDMPTKRFLLLVCSLLFALSTNLHAGKQDFTLVNKTGFDVHEVYVSPHGGGEWQEDVLGSGLLADGGTVKINFERQIKGKDWDLKVVDKVGKATTWEKLDLLSISKITLHFDNGKATAEVE